jgi:SNF2 family DNA or RNA helicase
MRIKNENPEASRLALMQLQAILKGCMLRRTKHTKDSEGKSIIHLPPRSTKIVSLTFPKPEQAFYNAIEQNVLLQFKDLQEKNIVMKNYSSVLVLLLRLRQAAW